MLYPEAVSPASHSSVSCLTRARVRCRTMSEKQARLGRRTFVDLREAHRVEVSGRVRVLHIFQPEVIRILKCRSSQDAM